MMELKQNITLLEAGFLRLVMAGKFLQDQLHDCFKKLLTAVSDLN